MGDAAKSGTRRCAIDDGDLTMSKIALSGVAWLVACGFLAPVSAQEEPGTTGVVVVRGVGVADPDERLGFVVGSELVMASVREGATGFEVVPGGPAGAAAAAPFSATLGDYDRATELGLLEVPGLLIPPYRFARDAVRLRQAVYGAVQDDPASIGLARGVVEGVLPPARAGQIFHNAFEDGQNNLGAPLLNPCGEVVGAIVAGLAQRGDAALLGSRSAVSGEWLIQRFDSAGLTPVESSCPAGAGPVAAQAGSPPPGAAAVGAGTPAAAEELAAATDAAAAQGGAASTGAAADDQRDAATQGPAVAAAPAGMPPETAAGAAAGAEPAEEEDAPTGPQPAAEEAPTGAEAPPVEGPPVEESPAEEPPAVEAPAAGVAGTTETEAGDESADPGDESADPGAAGADPGAAGAENVSAGSSGREVPWLLVAGIGASGALVAAWLLIRRSKARDERRPAAAATLLPRTEAERAAADESVPERPAVVIDGGADADGRRIALRIPVGVITGEAGAVVGRSPFESVVVLDHPEVSRRHFRLLAKGGSVMIEDLNATNGTNLDDVLLKPGDRVPLPDDGVLELGGLRVRVSVPK